MKSIFSLSFVATLILLTGCGPQSTVTKGKKDHIVSVPQDDVEMNVAIAKANASLDEFIKARESMGKDFHGLIKARFTEPGDNGAEHMWVEVSSVNRDNISGILLSSPDWLKNVKYGDNVTFPKSSVSDWVYVRDGIAHGGYTMRLLRDRMTPAEQAEYDKTSDFKFEG